jgi:hypothetical protein
MSVTVVSAYIPYLEIFPNLITQDLDWLYYSMNEHTSKVLLEKRDRCGMLPEWEMVRELEMVTELVTELVQEVELVRKLVPEMELELEPKPSLPTKFARQPRTTILCPPNPAY